MVGQGRSQVPVKNDPGFIQIDGRTAVRTGDKKLAFVRMQFAAALRAVKNTEGGGSRCSHRVYFIPDSTMITLII